MNTKLFAVCFVFLTILGFSNLSYANNWYLIDEANGIEIYWSQDIRLKINHRGNYLQWQMENIAPKSLAEKFFIKNNNPVRTFIKYLEIDCNLGRYRTIYFETYDSYMGKGNLIAKIDFEALETRKKNEWKYKIEDVRDIVVSSFCTVVKTHKK